MLMRARPRNPGHRRDRVGGGYPRLRRLQQPARCDLHAPITPAQSADGFSVSAFAYAADHYEVLAGSGHWSPASTMAGAGTSSLTTRGYPRSPEQGPPLAPDFAQVLDKQEIAALIGAQPRCGGIHYLRGGWLNPRAVCRALLAHPAITLIEGAGAVQLTPSEGQWQALDPSGNPIAEAPCSPRHRLRRHDANALAWLPLTSIRGQTTHYLPPIS
ncbi:MAG: hypothetical protein CM15mP74_04880 [Halieaceae bacterium]|nr:MAG: hypothetical protein CM15mP74_04880 [Halieaceae bacterium]